MIDWLSALPAWLVVLVIGASVVVESGFLLGLVLPGSTAVIAMGVMVGLGVVPAPAAYVIVVAAAVAGPSIGWRVGRVAGPALRTSAIGRRIPDSSWQTAERVIDTRGGKAVAVGQFIVGARTLVPLLVGMSSSAPYARFAVVSVPAATVWALLLTGAGHAAGASYQALSEFLGDGTVAVGVVAAVVIVVGLFGRFVAMQPRWGLLSTGDDGARWPTRVHVGVDEMVTARVGERRATWVSAVLWWVVAVIIGLATCAAMVWAVQRSNLEALDRSVATWVSDRGSGVGSTVARAVEVVLSPSTVLLATYLITAVVVFRGRGDGDRARRVRAVTISLGLAALAVASDSVASFVRDRSGDGDASVHFFDLQLAVVPCGLAIAVVLVAPWSTQPFRIIAWSAALVLTTVLVASRLVLATMTFSEVVVSLVVAAAWTVLLVGMIRPPDRDDGLPPEITSRRTQPE